jgi:D-alanine-D-alanine ligase
MEAEEVPLIPVRTVGITFNLKTGHGEDEEEYDPLETILALQAEIERYGFEVLLFNQDDTFLESLSRTRPDFVLNIAEGRGKTRSREAQVPCVLESLGIPFSGSDSLALGMTLDKYTTGQFLRSLGVAVPGQHMIDRLEKLDSLKGIFNGGRRYIVKPRWEGSSKGVFADSVVSGEKKLLEKVRYILERYHEPAIVEDFMPNEEVTVGLAGNWKVKVLGIMRVLPSTDPGEDFLYSIERKRHWRECMRYENGESLPASVRLQIETEAIKAYEALELRDMARIDLRLDSDGMPRVIDVNPLPGLNPEFGDLPILFELNGGDYPTLIRLLLEEAFSRCGLALPAGCRYA